MSSSRLRPAPWHELHVLVGLWAAVAAFVVPFLLIQPIADLLGAQGGFRDVGDTFEKAARIAAHADEALARAIAGNPLPPPPQLLGDPVAARVAWILALVSSALFVVVAFLATRRAPREVARSLGLDRFDAGRLWLPMLAVAVAYPLTGLYAVAVEALGLDPLVPAPGGLEPVLRDPVVFTLYAVAVVIAAPISEEAIFRGLAFTGTLTWGFLPAAVFTAALFALSHRDLASVIPFFATGLIIAWLYWHSGCLWDAIAFHVLFNGLSLMLLVARS
jgi:membrane protease YdiL (CAAX protease family)